MGISIENHEQVLPAILKAVEGAVSGDQQRGPSSSGRLSPDAAPDMPLYYLLLLLDDAFIAAP